ncbi:PLP-dependent aminotransferase family protein [uncultured Thomasclavelia sp.]|uniref:aminotransferase-like domain-containing protein n=1 Tax=uncultured Thomasclavelia sp. TaxID=3025759 RepID=UPI0025CBD2FC|nr:PLP-dependent aminotransferase family protein [uncultured Thomasclavelia sp.]
MNFEFSNRISGVKASAVREILKLMNDPEIISFGGGNPSSETFPVAKLKAISDDIFATNPNSVLEYGITEGDQSFKDAAVKFLSRHENIVKEYDQVMVTSGSQQIMDFVSKCLCNEGDIVVCENPSFLGALNAFKSNGAKLVGIEMEDDGINLEKLEAVLSAPKKPKLIYLIPNFQNPTGITTSLEKRKAIYQLAKKYQVTILEDNPYGDLRFKNEPIPSIKSLDDEGIVVYAASFSKIISPGMRVAIMIGHQDLMAKCTIAKQTNDVHTNAWAQSVMARFLQETDMDEHLKQLQAVYDKKCHLMLSEIEKNFPKDCTWTKPDGGMFIWVTLPERIDMLEFVQKAVEHKVAVVPGNAFYDDDSLPCQSFRMNFSMPSDEDIVKGVAILGELMRD